MQQLILFVLFTILLLSCNEETAFDPLKEPPYNRVTDSIRMDPSNAALYYRRGTLLYANNQPVFASRDIRKAWELQPIEKYALSLVTLLEEKHPDSAIIFIESALKTLPNSIALQISLARAYREKGQPDKAMAICEALIRQHPGQLDALVLQSELLKEKNRTKEAIQVLETAYSYAPGDVDVVHTLAFDYAEASHPKVIALADSLIREDKAQTHAEPYYFKGVYYSNTGQYAEAVRQFDAAIQRNYNFTQAYINKGIIYYEQKKYDEAMKVFRLASTVSPTEPGPYYWLGRTEEAMGQKAAAKLDYQRAYGLDKSFTEAREAAERL